MDSLSNNDPVEDYILEDNILKQNANDSIFSQQPSTVPKSFQWSIIISFYIALKHPGWEKILQKIKETT